MQIFEITPHVGIGKIKLGMSREDVFTLFGKPNFDREDRIGYLDGFMINFDKHNTVEFIELAKSAEYCALFNGIDLHNIKANDAVEFVNKFDVFDKDDPEIGYSYIFKKLQLSLWRGVLPECEHDSDGMHFETVGIGVDDYFQL